MANRYVVEQDGKGWRVVDDPENTVVGQYDTRKMADAVCDSHNRVHREKAPKRPAAKRGPPGNGLDLKAMSAAWKRAGKPCDWKAWCASSRHHIYKGGK